MAELRPRTSNGAVLRASPEKSVAGASGAEGAGAQKPSPVVRVAKLPLAIQFPLVLVLSLAVSSVAYSLLSSHAKGELARVSKSLDSWEDVAVVAGMRILELAIGWFGKFDCMDMAALSILSRGPYLYLLTTFYDVSPAPIVVAVAIELLSSYIPFQLLRPVSEAHRGAKSAPNREVTSDPAVQVYTSALATLVYSMTLLFAYRLFLPRVLVTHFTGIKSMAPAYDTSIASVLPVSLALGVAAKAFLFTPVTSTGASPQDAKLSEFDPVSASLEETLRYNVWGYTRRGKVGILRTAAVAASTFVNTYVLCSRTIADVEGRGACLYAAVWALASLFSGISLSLVGQTE